MTLHSPNVWSIDLRRAFDSSANSNAWWHYFVTQSHRYTMMVSGKKNWWPLITGKCHELKVSMATNCRHRFDDDWRMSWSFVNVITFTRGIRVSEHGVRHSIDKSDSVVAIEIEKPNQWPTCPEKVFDGLVETATYRYYFSLVFNRFANIINY